MTRSALSSTDRMLELLADRALFSLDDADVTELARLSPGFGPDAIDELDLAAGAAAVALLGPAAHAAMPESVARRARIAASAWDAARAASQSPRRAPSAPPRASSAFPWFAAAACLALAAVAWFSLPQQPATSTLALGERRDALVTGAADLVTIPWTATEDRAAASGVTGDVVWSDARNEGFMRIAGLAPNDPSVEQYQLWVFDAQRDERYPVDGGVFDIPAGTAEVIVPITTKVRVAEATLFAVTVEKPGGVVVSSRERLPILAQVAQK
jgi:anti-sigma-K factor RskA